MQTPSFWCPFKMQKQKASMIYLSPVQKEHAKRKWLDLEVVLSG